MPVQEGGERGDPVGGRLPRHPPFVVQGEVGDRSEGAGGVVLEGEPVQPLAVLAVGGQHDHRAVAPAQHLAEPGPGVRAAVGPGGEAGPGLAQCHHAQAAVRFGERAPGEFGEQQDERGPGLRCGDRPGRREDERPQPAEQVGPALEAVAALHGQLLGVRRPGVVRGRRRCGEQVGDGPQVGERVPTAGA